MVSVKGKEYMINNIKIVVTDMAGNIYEYNTQTIFDTKAPKNVAKKVIEKESICLRVL